MRRVLFTILAILFIMFVIITSCNKDDLATGKSNVVMVTARSGDFTIHLAGSGTVSIDWGDGTALETCSLLEYAEGEWVQDGAWTSIWGSYTKITSQRHAIIHNYSNKESRIISITGENITHLFCRYNLISSLDVSRNTAMTYLDCSCNILLTSLDVSDNSALAFLSCGDNSIKNLDVSNNSALTFLYCGNNSIKNLDVSRNMELRKLLCNNNLLTSLETDKNILLDGLNCDANQLSSIDLNNNITLASLNCSNNPLTSLDISKNIALEDLYCARAGLTSLDVSNNTALSSLVCYGGGLTSLDVSNNTALTYLMCSDNQLSSAALNTLFETLPEKEGGRIIIGDNPGTNSCDQYIAINKGWIVNAQNQL